MGYHEGVPIGVDRIRLHSGLSDGVKIIYGVALVVGIIASVIPALIVGAFTSVAWSGAGWAFAPLAFVLLTAPLVWRLLQVVRTAAWLEHTTLVVRSAFITRRCDLATAVELDVRAVPAWSTTKRTPMLIAYDSATGRRARLTLLDPATDQWLDPAKLHALAGAILAGRPRDPGGSPAWRAASALHAVATDPAAPLR